MAVLPARPPRPKLPSLNALPLVGRMRAQIMAPVEEMFSADRLPQEQYSDPPGDPGLFGPGSVTWRVHSDPSMLVGGLAALMLQTLHPLAMAGVAEHSDYREEPLGRLGRTASFVSATTYGSTAVAEEMIEMVKRIHLRVSGVAPDGRPYAASDPDLLRWVHMAEAANFLRAHQRFVPLPVRGVDLRGESADRYFHEMAAVAERLGATAVPRSRAEARAYFRQVRPELRGDAQALEAIGFLLHPDIGTSNPVIAMALRVVVNAAVGLLPPWGLAMLRLRRRPPIADWTVVRPAAYMLLNTLRIAGRNPNPLHEARRRCATLPEAAA